MKKSEILKLVKTKLWDGMYVAGSYWIYPEDIPFLYEDHSKAKLKYICHALEAILRFHLGSREIDDIAKCRELQEFAVAMLGPHIGTYEAWLDKHHRKLYLKMTDCDVQQGRQQWLNWMIKHFEEQGD